jgi:hypothetical protein
MSLLPRLCLLLALTGLASGCQPTPAAQGPGDVTANAVTGDPIEVTALDAPAPPSASATAAALSSAPPQGTAPPAGPEVAADEPAPIPASDDAAETGDEAQAVAEEEVVPPPEPKSPEQIACERKRGSWADTGNGLKTCITRTRDGGKRCTRESQCEGLCLARSGTCAPAKPLLGCNEILQDNGARVTLCIE